MPVIEKVTTIFYFLLFSFLVGCDIQDIEIYENNVLPEMTRQMLDDACIALDSDDDLDFEF